MVDHNGFIQKSSELAFEKRDLEKVIARSRVRIGEIDKELDELEERRIDSARREEYEQGNLYYGGKRQRKNNIHA